MTVSTPLPVSVMSDSVTLKGFVFVTLPELFWPPHQKVA
jgi:hypothetical protein